MSYEQIRAAHCKARKNYRCEWCAEQILIGEKHLSRAYKFEGDFTTGRMHLECEIAMNNSSYEITSEGWQSGEPARGEPLK
jgi:hypothetical protein